MVRFIEGTMFSEHRERLNGDVGPLAKMFIPGNLRSSAPWHSLPTALTADPQGGPGASLRTSGSD